MLMRLTKPLPSGNAFTQNPLRAEPWGIVTTGGARCRSIATGTISVASMRVSYLCSNGAYLVGETRRAAQPWKIFLLRGERANDLTDVSIAGAWW